MKKLGYSKAKKLALKQIAAKPEGFKYCDGSACFYVPTPEFSGTRTRGPGATELNDPVRSTTGCIVGELLEEVGVPHSVLATSVEAIDVWYESTGATPHADEPISRHIEITPKALEFLTNLQRAQDTGHTWQAAYDIAVARTNS